MSKIKPRHKSTKIDRNKELLKLWEEGASRKSLALKFDISLGRVGYIINREYMRKDNA